MMRISTYIIVGLVISILNTAPANAAKRETPFDASKQAAELDKQIDWSKARLIAVQDAGRYKTMDSFAREAISTMYGAEHFPGLSPMASLMEWLFNREAYADSPVIYIKDKGVRIHLSAHMTEVRRQRIQSTGYMTLREFQDPTVESLISELESNAVMVTAMRRVRSAGTIALALDRLVNFVPQPNENAEAGWHTPDDLLTNLPPDLRMANAKARPGARPIPGITEDQAITIFGKWAGVAMGWRQGDAARVQSNINELAEFLPTMADSGVYPSQAQRNAESQYYAWGKFTWGYWFYLLGMLIGVWAMVTGWRGPWITSMVILLIAMGVHAYGISVRWYILGRIPVANMFEAVVGSAWLGVAIGFLGELFYRKRLFLIAAHATGFFALILGGYVIPGGGTLSSIMGILDDVMLRIHTVLIIASYALIFLAAIIALIYLFGYYYHQNAARSAEVGLIIAGGGLCLMLMLNYAFQDTGGLTGIVKRDFVAPAFGYASAAFLLAMLFVVRRGFGALPIAASAVFLVLSGSLAIGNHGFAHGMAMTLIFGGAAWAAMNSFGMAMARRAVIAPEPAIAMSGGAAILASGPSLRKERPIFAGAMPGDEASRRDLPRWLHEADWCHLIILNIVFVMLFVGVILGAVWADYSWGRPWGWDPKEVFALNTWIIYAILIHTRFVTKNRGLWTAWLSVAGCLMMAFNWCFVNFFIVGLHSYA